MNMMEEKARTVLDFDNNDMFEEPPNIAKPPRTNNTEITNLVKRKRGTFEEKLFENEYINKFATEVTFDKDLLSMSKNILHPTDIMTKIKNIHLEVLHDDDVAPITKKLKTSLKLNIPQNSCIVTYNIIQ